MTKTIKEGLSAFPEISAFLGGISFTILTLIIQEDEKFNLLFYKININNIEYVIKYLDVIAFTLSFSIFSFIMCTIFFGISCMQKKEEVFNDMAQKSFCLFIIGFFTLGISVFVLIYVINIVIFILSFLYSVFVLAWWWRG